MNIVKGQMILLGATYSDVFENKHLIEGTCFYLDTKLVLRLLGFSTETYTAAVKDLVDIIYRKYNGKVCVFRRNIDEVSDALSKLAHNIKYKEVPNNFEMMLYYQMNKKKISYTDIEIYANPASIEKHLKNYNCKIDVVPDISWEREEDWIFNIDKEELLQIIRKQKPKWNIRSIENDIDSFIQINMLRKGNYSTLYGGKEQKLPIFVTSNYPLIKFIKNYIKDNQMNNTEYCKSPFIGDNTLMCQLWLPLYKDNSTIPYTIYNLTANAISSYENSFFIKLKDSALQLKEKHKWSVIDIDIERFKHMQTTLIQNNCNIEDLDGEALLTNYQEALIAKQLKLEEENREQCAVNQGLKEELYNKIDELIEEKSQKYITPKMSIWKLFYYLSKFDIELCCLIIIIIGSLLDIVESWIITTGIVASIGAIIKWILKIIDKKLSKKVDKIKLLFLNKSYNCLKNKITKKDAQYLDPTIEYIKSNTPYFEDL